MSDKILKRIASVLQKQIEGLSVIVGQRGKIVVRQNSRGALCAESCGMKQNSPKFTVNINAEKTLIIKTEASYVDNHCQLRQPSLIHKTGKRMLHKSELVVHKSERAQAKAMFKQIEKTLFEQEQPRASHQNAEKL